MKLTLNVEARKNVCRNVSSQIDYLIGIISFSNYDICTYIDISVNVFTKNRFVVSKGN